MPDIPNTAERLVRVETKLELVLDMMEEFKTDLRDAFKTHPTRVEYEDMKRRVEKVETKITNMWIKVGAISGSLGAIMGILATLIAKSIIG